MRYLLAIVLNGIAQIEYDRNKPLPTKQADYIDKMDTRMNNGIGIGEKEIPSPDSDQRAQFVASNLYHAIKANNETIAAAMTAYLAVRVPALKQVQISDKEGDVAIELIYDKEYKGQIGVRFEA